MTYLRCVKLDRFKGVSPPRAYHIDKLTAILGPMGAGKSSCHQAIRYALTGEVPDGKKDEVVATWFSPEGGSVYIENEFGWLRRGIEVDLGRGKKVTRILDTSETKEGDKAPNLEDWQSSSTVLNIEAFSAKSAEQKRRFILDLCGTSEETTAGSIVKEVALLYARELGGRAATADFLNPNPVWDEFKDDEQVALKEWGAGGGIRELIEAQCAGAQSMTLTDVCAKLVKSISEVHATHRKRASDAKGALNALEKEALEVRDIASEVSKREELVQDCQKAFAAATAAQSQFEDKEQAFRVSQNQAQSYRAELDSLEKKLRELSEKAPAEPEPFNEVEPGEPGPVLEATCDALLKTLHQHKSRLKERQSLEDQLTANQTRLKGIRESPWGRAWELSQELDEVKHKELREVIAELVKKEAEGIESLENWIRKAGERLEELPSLAKLQDDVSDVAKELEEHEQRRKDAISDYERARKEWSNKVREHAAAQNAFKAHGKGIAKVREDIQTFKGKIEELDRAAKEVKDWLEQNPSKADSIAHLKVSMRNCAEFLEEAVEAKGKVDAYENARHEMLMQSYKESAYKIALSAVKTTREKLVHEATKPITSVMDKVLEASGRSERVFLELENDRGTPQFTMGLIRGEKRIALGPLSGGENALFLVALTIAIALKSEGIRVVAVEADALDRGGLEQLRKAVEPWADDIQFILTTSREFHAGDNWRVISL